jgi:mannose-1-phosphate guanylyltransferase
MRHSIRDWLGEDRPKQYCTFTGSRSMLRHTWDRALRLTPEQRLVTVVAREHRRFVDEEAQRGPVPGLLIEQPRDRGTAPGLLLPLGLVLARDPQATVLVLPADHFLHPETAFLRTVASACLLAQKVDRLILLGAVPAAAETDYGWILPHCPPGLPLTSAPLPVASFQEKPSQEVAEELLAAGALWNTMILAAPVAQLWRLAQRLLPEPTAQLGALQPLLRQATGSFPRTAAELVALESTYRTLPRADFSRDLLQAARDQQLVVPLAGVDWSDWGRPERVVETLERLGGPVPFTRFPATGSMAAVDGVA